MTTNPLWTDADALAQFDLSMRGAEEALSRLRPRKPYDNQLSYMEVLFWIGAAIDAMKLQDHDKNSIFAGIHWVRNKAAHHQAKLMKLLPEVNAADPDWSDYVFESPNVIGVEYGNIKNTPVAGYVRHLEGKSVRMYLTIAYLELADLAKQLRPE